MPTVRVGSSNARSKSSSAPQAHSLCSGVLKTAVRVTSDPVPAVVGTAILGSPLRGSALALNATMANGAQAAPDAYAQVAEALGVDTRGMAPHEAAAAAPAAYDAWLREVGLKLSLDDHGLGAGDASRIAALCAEPANKTIMDNDSFAYTSEAIEAAVARLLAAA